MPPKSDDVIYEQPLTVYFLVRLVKRFQMSVPTTSVIRRLWTKILTDGWSPYEHFQELSFVVFVCCRMALMLTSNDIIGILSTIQRI